MKLKNEFWINKKTCNFQELYLKLKEKMCTLHYYVGNQHEFDDVCQ